MSQKIINNILYISTFPPRECGIATFTKDLVAAMNKKFNPIVRSGVVAVNNESTDIYNYENNVASQITATNIEDYVSLANKINENNNIKIVHVQHEFGIFGGENGNHLLPFFQVIKKPVIVTFHSVLPKPKINLKHVVQFITKSAEAIIVMNKFSKEILEKEYEAEKSKIFVIPHGVPQVPFSQGQEEKQKLHLEKKFVLSTFGLLNKGKGIEYVINALPEIVKIHPNIIYLIIGATHPVIRRKEGESYRNFLRAEIERLKLKNYVKFYNKYLCLTELISYIKATDIYLSPSLDLNQSVSGTISYALGCGKPVISTSSSYAKSIVNEGRGILVKPKNSEEIKKALFYLIQTPKTRNLLARNAYAETRHMTWPNVALSHFDLYQKYASLSREEKLPQITLKHLETLTDSFGIIQFAKNAKPDIRYGYSLDDSSRAAIVVIKHWMQSKNEKNLKLLQIYLDFIKFVQKSNGKFANFVTSQKIIKETEVDEDAEGRAIWALGYIIAEKNLPLNIRQQAEEIFRKTMSIIKNIKSPRAIAFTILGIYYYNRAYPLRYVKTLKKFADYQMNCYLKTASKDWFWFENYLTYSNSKLSESLFYAYLSTNNKNYLDVAEKSLNFLMGITFNKECFSPIGASGWYFRYGKRAYFDQQPEDASSMVQTLLIAYKATKKEIYKKRAFQAFFWFLGKNYLNQMVYDEATGGCYDGLGQYSLNMNQGAESTISYLLARLELEDEKTNKY